MVQRDGQMVIDKVTTVGEVSGVLLSYTTIHVILLWRCQQTCCCEVTVRCNPFVCVCVYMCRM